LTLALTAGFGYVVLRETLDGSIRKVQHLALVAGGPPLAVIPHFDLDAEGPGRARRRVILLGVLTAMTLVVLLLAHWLWSPLDVLWYRGLRRLDSMLD
jgi:hypothetical protein